MELLKLFLILCSIAIPILIGYHAIKKLNAYCEIRFDFKPIGKVQVLILSACPFILILGLFLNKMNGSEKGNIISALLIITLIVIINLAYTAKKTNLGIALLCQFILLTMVPFYLIYKLGEFILIFILSLFNLVGKGVLEEDAKRVKDNEYFARRTQDRRNARNGN